jgi:hypothetical protein
MIQELNGDVQNENQQAQEPFGFWACVLVAGDGFEPPTFGL